MEGHPNIRADVRESLRKLPNKRGDAGEFSLLRVIASSPALSREQSLVKGDPEKGRRARRHPIASLNMKLVEEIMRKLSPPDILQSLRGPEEPQPLVQGLKRKRTQSSGTIERDRKKVRID